MVNLIDDRLCLSLIATPVLGGSSVALRESVHP